MTTHYPTEEVHIFKTDESGTFTLPGKNFRQEQVFISKKIHQCLLNGQEIQIKEGHDWAEPILVQVKESRQKGNRGPKE